MQVMLWILLALTIEPAKLSSVNEIYSVKTRYYLKTIIPESDTMPAESSIVSIGYTPKELVIFARNYQKGIHASSRRRDADGVVRETEDCFYVYLATHGIGKDAYFIGVNPLGAIADRVISPSGITQWDGDIRTKARITDYGWDVLLVIPFNTISYNEGPWGVDFARFIAGSNMEIQLLVPRKNPNDNIHIARMKLDFSYIKKSKGFSIFLIPSIRYTYNEGEKELKGGLTARWRKGQSTLMEATVYPDYSELETDVQEFDISLLPVDYPEKRPFFVEGMSFYTPPVSLIRTRNIDLPKFGAKFYSTTENSIFTIYALNTNLVNDTSYNFLEFYRYAYNFSKSMRAGVFGIFSEIGYNLVSFDFTNYFPQADINFDAEAARVIDNGANFVNLHISRSVTQGIGGFLTVREIDSNFVSPLNYIQFNFDGIRWISGNLGYTKYFKKRGRLWVFGAKVYGRKVVDKYSKDRIMKILKPTIFWGPYPWFLLFEYEDSKLDYLKGRVPEIHDVGVKFYKFGLFYNGSTWRNVQAVFGVGEYGGEKAYLYFLGTRYSFFGFINLGTENYRIIMPSVGQNFLTLQLFGEIALPYHIFLKPYINYTGNCSERRVFCIMGNKSLSTNLIIAYEPKYLTGIYLAINTTKSGDKNSKTGVLKFQVGYKIIF